MHLSFYLNAFFEGGDFMIIAIDGVSGAGKSSLAKEVAKELDYGFFSAGAFYRAITYEALKRGISDLEDEALKIMMNELQIKLLYDESKTNVMMINNKNITEFLYTEEISNNVAKYSLKPFIREKVRVLQKETRNNNSGVVMEGRDIGSEIFPDAEVKIFVTCSAEVRAQRRVKDYEKLGEYVDVKKVEQELIERDYRDMHREISPLKKCDDAILIDTSNKNILECSQIVVSKVREIESQNKKEAKSIFSHFEKAAPNFEAK